MNTELAATRERIVTYRSDNAEPRRIWVAYVDLGEDYLGIRFEGHTEDEARTKAEVFWEKDRKLRESNRQKRADALAKARDAKKAKRQPETDNV